MKKFKKQNGITLVALVITIIILLILAAISIQALTNTGLFDQAKRAKNVTEEKTAEENDILENYLAQINEITGGTSGGVQGSAETTTNTTHTATDISTYTWDELSSMAKAISNNSAITNDTLEVNVTINGKTKTLGVGDYTTVDSKKVRILGFNHDTLTTPTAYGATTATGKAGISFEYVDFIDVSGTGAGTTTAKMNSDDTNSGGWEACDLRSTLNGTAYNSLSIKNKIKQVKKDYIPAFDTASTTKCDDYLWLLSCGEIWDNGYGGNSTQATRGYAIVTEGSQYKYYKLGNPTYSSSSEYTKKPNVNDKSDWWLRSPAYIIGLSFCCVFPNGSCSYNYYVSYGVAPGFCI